MQNIKANYEKIFQEILFYEAEDPFKYKKDIEGNETELAKGDEEYANYMQNLIGGLVYFMDNENIKLFDFIEKILIKYGFIFMIKDGVKNLLDRLLDHVQDFTTENREEDLLVQYQKIENTLVQLQKEYFSTEMKKE